MAFDPVVAEILREQGSLSARLDAVERCIMNMKDEEKKEDMKEGEDEGPESEQELWIPSGGASAGGATEFSYDGFPL